VHRPEEKPYETVKVVEALGDNIRLDLDRRIASGDRGDQENRCRRRRAGLGRHV